MSPSITIPTDHVPALRRELSRVEARRRWPWRSGATAAQLRTVRVHLGAAMLEAMEKGEPTVTLDLGDATDLVFEALDRLDAAPQPTR